MNWDAISAISDLLASLAVIASLVYLGIQVKQSNKFAHGQSRRDYIDKGQQEIFLAFENPKLFAWMTAAQLSGEDKVKLHCFLLAAMRLREFEWSQHRHGIVDDATYGAHKQIVPIILGTPRSRAWWLVRGKQAFNPEFVRFVDALLEQAPLTEYWNVGDNW
jgi:hypothetical protein